MIPFFGYIWFHYTWFRYSWFHFPVIPDSRFKNQCYNWFRYTSFRYITFHFSVIIDSGLWVSVIPVSYFPNPTWFRYIPFRYARMRYTRFCTPVINVEHVAHDRGAIRRHKEWLPTYEMVVSPWVCLNGMMTRLQKKPACIYLSLPSF